jgi:pimeloyl-ACP methyl ester carboxylesterase
MNVAFGYETTRQEIAGPRGSISFHVAGEGAPLLLLHGSGPGVSGWANFAGNLATFAAGHKTIIMDMPGYGASEPTDGHPFYDAAEAVLALLDHLGIQRVAVVGNSMGGGVAARLAADCPDRVHRIVAIGGVGETLLNAAPAEGIRLLRKFSDQPTRERLVEWLECMVFDNSIITTEMIESRLALATQPAALDWARRMPRQFAVSEIGKAALAEPRWVHLERIQCPTLLTWGRDDRVTPIDRMLVPMRLIANCETHIFPRSGHWVMIEQREAFESVVSGFLARKFG